MPDRYQLIDAAYLLARLIREADDSTLDAAFQILATRANDSDVAHTHERLRFIAESMQAEFRLRRFREDEPCESA